MPDMSAPTVTRHEPAISYSPTDDLKERQGTPRRQRSWPSVDPILLVLLFLSSYLLFVRLDNAAFWDDEAHIALMARNFMNTGTWTGWDGRNLIAYNNGANLEANLRHIIPQLDAPVMAASFRLFGVSTWAGRFPFAVAGLLSLVVFALLLKREFPRQRSLQLFAFASLAFSVHFLLSVRTCRYYALAILFALLVFVFYRQAMQRQRVVDFVWLGLWSLLLFLTSCLNAAAFLLALAVVHFVFHWRELDARGWGKLCIAIAILLAGAVPYAVLNRVWDFPLPVTQPWLQRKTLILISNLSGLNWIGLPWIVALGLAYFAAIPRLRKERSHGVQRDDAQETSTSLQEDLRPEAVVARAREWGVLVGGFLLFLSILSPHQIVVGNDEALRYMFVLLPWLAGLSGMLMWFISRRMRLLALAMLVVLIGSNMLSLSPANNTPRLLLADYIAEVHQPYPTAYSEVVAFLQEHARFDDKVLAAPQHMNYPLMFYMGDRVRIASVIDRKTHLSLDLVRALPAPLIREENFPDWLVSFGTWPDTPRTLRFFSRPHTHNGRRIQYSYRLFTTLDVFYEQTQRPEISWHSFGPHRSFNRSKNAVYIYRRSAPRVLDP